MFCSKVVSYSKWVLILKLRIKVPVRKVLVQKRIGKKVSGTKIPSKNNIENLKIKIKPIFDINLFSF